VLYEQLHQQKFISLIYAEYSSIDNTLTWVGAGQEYVLVLKNDNSVQVIKTGGVILGMVEEIEDKISQNRIFLEKGEKILLYTDGAVELRNSQSEMFSKERLVDAFRQTKGLNIRQTLDFLQQQLLYFSQGTSLYDDITLVVLEREN
ncbi:MAG: hypothetical protein B6D55_08410, partial [Candidatus Omnitrophica bacterium 4484_70.2]